MLSTEIDCSTLDNSTYCYYYNVTCLIAKDTYDYNITYGKDSFP